MLLWEHWECLQLSFLNLSQQQVTLEKRTEINAELGVFHARLVENFNNRETCVNTLGGLGATISDGQTFTTIMSNSTPPVNLYTVNDQFGRQLNATDRAFKIKSITLLFDTIRNDPPPASNKVTSATLRVIYEVSNLLTSYQGNREKPRSIPLGDVQLTENSGTYTLRDCVGNTAFFTISRKRRM